MSHLAHVNLEMKSRPSLLAVLEREDAIQRVGITAAEKESITNTVRIRLEGWLGPITVNFNTGQASYDSDNLANWRGNDLADKRWRQLEDLKMFYVAEQAKLTAEENGEEWSENWDDDGDLYVDTEEVTF